MGKKIKHECRKSIIEKEYDYVLWQHENKPIGHSNINHISFKHTAKIHFHIWNRDDHKSGFGKNLLSASVDFFFEKFQLEEIYCELYINNEAPNKLLSSLGFDLIQTYRTVPGIINFDQKVNQYKLMKNNWKPFSKE